ncbi:unnamed protein product [Notodromas monacha]|uniref:PPM-type phosphatase domain-containing protein n=1 Tax=Notodromas monacha TaxID=399045 RepID=A0A7R9BFP2_9CRUS|nr:unnamed protein product [Notodromas monacha]CAG0913918.1 unnamed protein product [Notodromas monacha]
MEEETSDEATRPAVMEDDLASDEGLVERTPSETSEQPTRKLLAVIDELQTTTDDTRKLTYMLILAKLLNQSACAATPELRRRIFDAIGPEFLLRLLKTDEAPMGCSRRAYQSIAVTIMCCLASDEVLVADRLLLPAIPHLLQILVEGALVERNSELTVIQDAYECLISFASNPNGSEVLIENGAMEKLVNIIAEERFNHEQALQVLLQMVRCKGCETWRSSFLMYLTLVDRLSTDFEKRRTKEKAMACRNLTQLLLAAPNEMLPLKDASWLGSLQRGLADILGSRIDKELRDAALHLSATVTITIHPSSWLYTTNSQLSSRDCFIVLLVRLTVVELRLLLEDIPLDSIILEKNLLGSCLTILENVMMAIFSGDLQNIPEEDKTEIYASASEGTEVVMVYFVQLYDLRFLDGELILDEEERDIFMAMIRLLSARMMEDPTAFGSDACKVLPGICKFVTKPGNNCDDTLWNILLPVFLEFSGEENTRKILVSEDVPVGMFSNFEEVRKRVLTNSKIPGCCINKTDVNTLKLMLGLLLNILVGERDAARRSGRGYSQYWRPVFDTLLELGNDRVCLPLVAHLVVCGLMLTRIFPECEEAIAGAGSRSLSATVRFLWDAFNIEESEDGQHFDVSFSYKPMWNEVKDLWFIGMDCITRLIESNKAIAEFVMLVDWPAEIVKSLIKSLPVLPHIALIFENFLLTLAKKSPEAAQMMLDEKDCFQSVWTQKDVLTRICSAAPVPFSALVTMSTSIGVNLRVTGHCCQGGRKYMEDVFCVAYQQTEDDKDLEYAFIGIFDGHGGAEAAAFAKKHLMDNIVNQRNFWSTDDQLVLKAIKEGFITTHHGMWRELPNWPKTASGLPSTSGTTASIAFVRRKKIYVGHVGDSGIVLGQTPDDPEAAFAGRWQAQALTEDHKPTIPEEQKRIEQCGGKVKYKSGVMRVVWNRPKIGHKGPVTRSTKIDEIPFLAVARSLGDLWSYNAETDEFVVSPEPDVFVIPIDLTKHRVLIFGTDGLWNMVSPVDAVNSAQETEIHNEAQIITRASNPSAVRPWINPSKKLVDLALDRWQKFNMRADNISAVTVMLDWPGPPKNEVATDAVVASSRPQKVILRQAQLKRKKCKDLDQISVHSNLYDTRNASGPVRVPLFEEKSEDWRPEKKPRVDRPRLKSPLPTTRTTPKYEVQSPEVSSSIDDVSLSSGKSPKSAGMPRGRIHRVSGSIFVNANTSENPPDVHALPHFVGFGKKSSASGVPMSSTTNVGDLPPCREDPLVADAIDTLSRIVDRMPVPAIPTTSEPVAPAPPPPARPVSPVSVTPVSTPVESRILRSTHHTGLPATGKDVSESRRRLQLHAERSTRVLRSETRPRVIATRAKSDVGKRRWSDVVTHNRVPKKQRFSQK